MATSKVNDARGTRIIVGLVPALYDKVDIAYPNALTEVYTFSYSDNVVGVVTLIKDVSGNLVSAERTA
jgi:hypothetical protein